MGERLLKYYEYVFGVSGAAGKAQLAVETKMPAIKAAFHPDSKQNLELFHNAVTKITGKEAPLL